MALKPISVSQFNSYVKRILQTDPLLGNVSVIGEISNLKYHGSGHVFFTLKDDQCKLSCFLPSDTAKRLRYELVEGMLVTASGYISVYDKGGTYSLNIRDVSISGTGSLSMAFEALKVKLHKEGLFDSRHKKTIPPFPKQIALITSETGAAVRDILKIIRQRNNVVRIILFPSLVQGPDAAKDIAWAIEEVNRFFPETDLIITGRGGGSIEELWAFNEEIVVRSIFLSQIPVISAVGHESDFTLSDYVADKRAATPTEAGQLAVPSIDELNSIINITALELLGRLDQILKLLELKVDQYNMAGLREHVSGRITFAKMKTQVLIKDLFHGMEKSLFEKTSLLESLERELRTLNPYSIMARGYVVLLDEKGSFLGSLKDVKRGDLLTILHKDGKIISSVRDIKEGSYGKENS